MRCARSRKAIRNREETRWDEQMDQDSTSGKLDFLFQEAEDESAQGLVRESAVNSVATRRFWVLFHALPVDVQQLAFKNYHL
jgi:hypothetical protein